MSHGVIKEHEPQQISTAAEEQSTAAPAKKIRMGWRAEWRVLVVVIAVFLVLELAFQWGGDRLSKDISHLRSFSSIAEELAESPASEGERILFLGNSLTRHGIDPAVFQEVCRDEFDLPVQLVKVNPDNTALADWFYAYRNFFSRPGLPPEVLILGFEGGHLRDAPSRHPERLAQFYCSSEDYEDLAHYDLKSFEDWTNFMLCQNSAAFGNRERIQRKVLDLLIPDYRPGMDELNRRMNVQAQHQQAAPPEPTYQRLAELIALAEREQVQVILTAMPVPQAYSFDPELLELVASTSAELVDCRNVPGLTTDMFFDGLHMDETAARLYSRFLAERYAPLLRSERLLEK